MTTRKRLLIGSIAAVGALILLTALWQLFMLHTDAPQPLDGLYSGYELRQEARGTTLLITVDGRSYSVPSFVRPAVDQPALDALAPGMPVTAHVAGDTLYGLSAGSTDVLPPEAAQASRLHNALGGLALGLVWLGLCALATCRMKSR